MRSRISPRLAGGVDGAAAAGARRAPSCRRAGRPAGRRSRASMPTVHSANRTAPTHEPRLRTGARASRRRGRACCGAPARRAPAPRHPESAAGLLVRHRSSCRARIGLARRDDGLLGRRRRRHPLDDDRLIRASARPGAARCVAISSIRRGDAQRLDLEPQVAVDFFLRRALAAAAARSGSRAGAARSAARPRTAAPRRAARRCRPTATAAAAGPRRPRGRSGCCGRPS